MIQTPLADTGQSRNDSFKQGFDHIPAVFGHRRVPPLDNTVPRGFNDAPDQFAQTCKGNTDPVHQRINKAVPINIADKGCNIVSDSLPICVKQELTDSVNDAFEGCADILCVLSPVNRRKHIVHAGCKATSEGLPINAGKRPPDKVFQIRNSRTNRFTQQRPVNVFEKPVKAVSDAFCQSVKVKRGQECVYCVRDSVKAAGYQFAEVRPIERRNESVHDSRDIA